MSVCLCGTRQNAVWQDVECPAQQVEEKNLQALFMDALFFPQSFFTPGLIIKSDLYELFIWSPGTGAV